MTSADLLCCPSAEISFVCRLHTSKAFKLQHGGRCSMLVEGSFRSFPQPLFVALCTPTADRLQSHAPHSCRGFSSVHRLDMSVTQASDRCGQISERSDFQDVIPAFADSQKLLCFFFQCFVFFRIFKGGDGGPVLVQPGPP